MAQKKEQKEVVERVMHEFKHGELETRGRPVRNPKQAIAIALHEAGASRDESDAQNAENLRRTRQRERQGDTAEAGESRAALYAEAKRRGIPGRSKMSKEDLKRALRAG